FGGRAFREQKGHLVALSHPSEDSRCASAREEKMSWKSFTAMGNMAQPHSYFSCLRPSSNPAIPTTPPRNRKKDLVSGSEGSVFGGQSTPSPSALSVVPRPTSSFQRSAIPYSMLSCGPGRRVAEVRRGDVIG